MIYDLIPVVTRHHRIKLRKDNEDHPFTIISKHVSVLATCSNIYSETTSLRTRLQAAEPLRIIRHWRCISGAILRAVLRCASKKDDYCSGRSDLEDVLLEVQRQVEMKQRAPWEVLHEQDTLSPLSLLTDNPVFDKTPIPCSSTATSPHTKIYTDSYAANP
jgi:hypothetical protein